MDNTIVPNNTVEIMDGQVTAATVQAIQALKSGRVPPHAIKTHPGKGGKQFVYASHIHGTKTMNEAFDQLWDMEVLRETVYPDNSATVAVKVTVHFMGRDGNIVHSRTVTELGGREQIDNMPLANVVLGAASRGLMRCMLRMFNYGAEFYKNEEDDFTPNQAWTALLQYAQTRKLPKEKLLAYVKEQGIAKVDLVDKFMDVYSAIHALSVEHMQEEQEAREEEARLRALAQAEEKAKKAAEEAEAARKALQSDL